MQAGRLRERVTVTRAVVANDGGTPVPGAPGTVQTPVAAEIQPATEARLARVFASQVQAVATHVVRIRAGHSWTVKVGDVLVWHDALEGDRSLNVVGVADPDGRRTELVIAVTERRG